MIQNRIWKPPHLVSSGPRIIMSRVELKATYSFFFFFGNLFWTTIMMCLSLSGRKFSDANFSAPNTHLILRKQNTYRIFVLYLCHWKWKRIPHVCPVVVCLHNEGYTALFSSLCGPLDFGSQEGFKLGSGCRQLWAAMGSRGQQWAAVGSLVPFTTVPSYIAPTFQSALLSCA